MRFILATILISFVFSCKKDNASVPHPPLYASNKIEGDIFWPGSTTYFINLPPSGQIYVVIN